MPGSTRSERQMSRLGGIVLAAMLSISLGLYMLYDPHEISRGSGPVVIAGLDLKGR